MVVVFHDGLRSYSRTGAVLATVVFAATFVPFVYSKSVMTEQLYLSGLILCLSSTLNYLQTGSRFRLVLVGASILAMMLTRVQGVFIGLVVFPFLLFFRPQFYKSIMAVAVGVAVVMSMYAFVYSAQVRITNRTSRNLPRRHRFPIRWANICSWCRTSTQSAISAGESCSRTTARLRRLFLRSLRTSRRPWINGGQYGKGSTSK